MSYECPCQKPFALPPISAVKQERNKQNEIVNIESIPEVYYYYLL